MTVDPKVANIIACWDASSDADLQAGRHWYETASTFALGLADRFNVTHDQASAIVAILSPRVTWSLNMVNAESVLAERDAPTFDRSVVKCLAIIDAGKVDTGYSFAGRDHDKCVSGPKVTAFYETIRDPEGSTAVVVDRHAIDIALGKKGDDRTRPSIDTDRKYQPWADAYRTAANIIGVPPHVLQATTWVSWRRRHGVVDAYTELEDF